MFEWLWCAVWHYSVITWSIGVTNLELMETFWRYFIRMVFDELFSSGTMESSISIWNLNSLRTFITLQKAFVPYMGVLLQVYCDVLEFFIRMSQLPISLSWIVWVFKIKLWHFSAVSIMVSIVEYLICEFWYMYTFMNTWLKVLPLLTKTTDHMPKLRTTSEIIDVISWRVWYQRWYCVL